MIQRGLAVSKKKADADIDFDIEREFVARGIDAKKMMFVLLRP
jgi:hypothetical protein